MRHDGFTFELRPTESGQVGFFGDQLENWQWLRGSLAAAAAGVGAGPRDPAPDGSPLNILNLFAYTGATTLVAARAGATVSHVDSSRPAVGWARRNAALSGLEPAPIRWIVDDAVGFAAREVRRVRRYDGIILDPPTYGHGRDGRRWELGEGLRQLLDTALALTQRRPTFVLLTAHSEGLEPADLHAALEAAMVPVIGAHRARRIEAAPMVLRARSGREARAGVVARWRR